MQILLEFYIRITFLNVLLCITLEDSMFDLEQINCQKIN